MYENLKLEMFKSGITQKEIADFLGIHENSMSNKLAKGPFSIEEAFAIKNRFFPALDIAYLFKNTLKAS